MWPSGVPAPLDNICCVVRVLLLDLGGTLTDGDQTFSHVPEALTALRKFHGSVGEPVELCLVSDYVMPDPTGGPAVRTLFSEYLRILDRLGLRRFFRPVSRHVTLSTHAGVMKPDRRVYELALARSGTDAGLDECLSITEDAGHIAACRRLGMETLRFGQDFSDWCEAPLLVRHVVDPTDAHNTTLALAVWFAVQEDVRYAGLVGEPTAHGVRVRVRPAIADGTSRWGKASVVELVFDSVGRVVDVEWESAAVTAEWEAATFFRSLQEHGQMATAGVDTLPPGATHAVERDERGNDIVRRKRFSAF
jgi:hypothetical protein